MNPEEDFTPLEVAYCHAEEIWLPAQDFYWIGHEIGCYNFFQDTWENVLEFEADRNIENRLIPRAVCIVCVESGFSLDFIYKGENRLPIFM